MDGRMSPPPLGEAEMPRKSRAPLFIGIAIGSFVLLTLAVGLCAGLFLPALGAARNSARMMQSQRNLGEIGAALVQYAADNKDELPEAGTDLAVRLAPYLGQNTRVWNVPRGGDIPQAYYYVPIGKIADLKNPAMQPLMYEAPGLWRREGGNVLYADGSVRHTDGLAYRTMIDKITLPDGKKWTPHK